MEFNPLIPIGSEIKVDKLKIKHLLAKKLLDALPRVIVGSVIDYKMTDGKGIGYVLMTQYNQEIWIFEEELTEQTKSEYSLKSINTKNSIIYKEMILAKNNLVYEINGNRNVKSVANPINFISWLIFTLKDIF